MLLSGKKTRIIHSRTRLKIKNDCNAKLTFKCLSESVYFDLGVNMVLLIIFEGSDSSPVHSHFEEWGIPRGVRDTVCGPVELYLTLSADPWTRYARWP